MWRAGFHPGPCPVAAASHQTACAAASSHGALEFAKRLECPRLLALCEAAPVEPGHATSRCHRAGLKARLPMGCYHQGLTQRRRGASCRRAAARRKRWPIRVVYLREHRQQRDERSAQRRKEGLGGGAVETSCGESGVRSSRPASSGLRPGREVCGVGRPSGARSAGPWCSRKATLPRG